RRRKMPMEKIQTVIDGQEEDRIRQKQALSDLKLWTVEYRQIKGLPFSFEGHEYLKGIYSDMHPIKIIQKCSQVGISEYFISETFWLGEKGYNSLFIFPAEPQLNDFSHARVDRAIEESPHLLKAVQGISNVGLKKVGRAYIYYRGSQKPRQLKSIDSDANYLDEVDEITPEAIELSEKRLGHSKLKWRRATSTPTYPEMGINKMWLLSDMREWFVKCHACGLKQTLDFFKNLVAESGKVLCEKCHNPINRLADGEWIAGKHDKDMHGYHVPKLACSRTNIKELIENSKKTDQDAIQVFWNSDLGLPYMPKGGQLSGDILDVLRGDFLLAGAGDGCVMGVDVGGLLNIVILKPVPPDRLIYAGTVEEFEELDRLMTLYGVLVAVVDAMPETRKSMEFCKRWTGKAWHVFYTDSNVNDPKHGYFKADEVGKEEETGALKISANRTLAADYMIDRLVQRQVGVPSNLRQVEDFYSHMVAPMRVVKRDAKGIERAFYINAKPDHYFHAWVYAEMARRIAGVELAVPVNVSEGIELGSNDRMAMAGSLAGVGNDREYLSPLYEND
ncbi:MAG: phage terminase large subunit family protein, partial [Patescibacteria group bacterium]